MKRLIALIVAVAVGGVALAVSVSAQAVKVPPISAQQVTLSYAPVVKRAAPAVVNIYTKKTVRQRIISPFFDDPFFQHFFGGAGPQGLMRERLESSLGSGVIVRPDGLIVTNNHVIAGAEQIKVVLADRREFEARIVTADERTDLAVIRLEAKGETLPFIELGDSDDIEVGDLVLAIGNPFGVGQTVTKGIISALARTTLDINDINYFIQTDAAINPGNSGGALVAMDGRLVGINSAIFSRSGGSMGIGFAIPSNIVRTVVAAHEAGKKTVVRPWTGISGQDVTSEVAASLGLPNPSGVLVNALHPASEAKRSGLKIGDVIRAVNGRTVEDPAAFRYRMATMPLGSSAVLNVFRNGQTVTVMLPLIAPPEYPPRKETRIRGNNPLAGAVVANLSPAVSEELGLNDAESGAVVVSLEDNAAAGRFGLRPRDIVMRVNDTPVQSVDDIEAAVQKGGRSWRIALGRNGNVINLMVGG